MIKVEVITIGNELLDGRRTDTNTTWIGHQLHQRGTRITYQQSVNDLHEDIQEAFLLASKRSDIVISTGGLGPTLDDITFESVARAADVELEYHEEVFAKIQKKYQARGLTAPESNKRQAMIPQGSTIIENAHGTAPGLSMKINNAFVFVFPGVPLEMKKMFHENVVPLVEKNSNTSWHSFQFSFFGLAEAVIEEKVLGDLDTLGITDQIDYSITASFPLVRFVFRVQKSNAEKLEKLIQDHFFSQYSQYLWTFHEKTIEQHVILTLKEKGWSLHVAESTSGGMLSSSLVDVPGCSEVFHQGLVTYSNAAKVQLLGVSQATLDTHGAVSPQCALEMAQGLRTHHGADVAVSTTGIAGPTGGSRVKPVGRTYIAWAGPGFEDVKEYTFAGDRQRNRVLTTYHALIELYNRIK